MDRFKIIFVHSLVSFVKRATIPHLAFCQDATEINSIFSRSGTDSHKLYGLKH